MSQLGKSHAPRAVAVLAGLAAVVAALPALASPTAASAASVTSAARFRCHGVRATIVGTPHDDRIKGTNHRDVIVARGGADVVVGLAGRDLICGGAGADLLDGMRGLDLIYGGTGRDQCFGEPAEHAHRHFGCEVHTFGSLTQGTPPPPPPQGTAPQGTTPQRSTAQGTTAQGTTAQGTTAQGTTARAVRRGSPTRVASVGPAARADVPDFSLDADKPRCGYPPNNVDLNNIYFSGEYTQPSWLAVRPVFDVHTGNGSWGQDRRFGDWQYVSAPNDNQLYQFSMGSFDLPGVSQEAVVVYEVYWWYINPQNTSEQRWERYTVLSVNKYHSALWAIDMPFCVL